MNIDIETYSKSINALKNTFKNARMNKSTAKTLLKTFPKYETKVNDFLNSQQVNDKNLPLLAGINRAKNDIKEILQRIALS